MALSMWAVWLLCLPALSSCHTIIPLSQQDKEAIVNQHNDYRRQETASDIELMEWDEALAFGAGLLAETCTNDHGFLTWDGMPFEEAVGQNLFASASNYGPTWPLEYWWDERLYYSYDTTQCSWMCYHYTQMAWWSNNKIGCAKILCEPLYTPGTGYQSHMYYFVCNYAPGGNYVNQWPFSQGESCSRCQERLTRCKDGLCTSKDICDAYNMDCECSLKCGNCGVLNEETCTCSCAPGYFSNGCDSPCEDRSDRCGGELPVEYCEQPDTKQLMINECPLLCGVCEPYDEAALAEWCAATEAPVVSTTTPEPGPSTSLTMYQSLCQLYGLFCDLA